MTGAGRHRGFSIVEVLVAAVLLSALIIPVVNLLQSSSSAVAHGAVATQALFLAQQHLEALQLQSFEALHSLPETTSHDGRYRVTVDVEPFEGDEAVKRVSVLLRWNDLRTRKTRSIGLRMLRCRREGQ